MSNISEVQLIRLLDRLAKRTCCNNYSGFCVIKDIHCGWRKSDEEFYERGIICKWSREAVLPADKDVEAFYERWKVEAVKKQEDAISGVAAKAQKNPTESVGLCFGCQEPIVMRSNRQKYCDKCAQIERLRRDAARKRRARNS